MLLLFSIRVAEWPLVLEGAVRSVFCVCVCVFRTFVRFCVCPSIPFGIQGRM